MITDTSVFGISRPAFSTSGLRRAELQILVDKYAIEHPDGEWDFRVPKSELDAAMYRLYEMGRLPKDCIKEIQS